MKLLTVLLVEEMLSTRDVHNTAPDVGGLTGARDGRCRTPSPERGKKQGAKEGTKEKQRRQEGRQTKSVQANIFYAQAS